MLQRQFGKNKNMRAEDKYGKYSGPSGDLEIAISSPSEVELAVLEGQDPSESAKISDEDAEAREGVELATIEGKLANGTVSECGVKRIHIANQRCDWCCDARVCCIFLVLDGASLSSALYYYQVLGKCLGARWHMAIWLLRVERKQSA